jgi:PPOX class probable FMN-dependent enzyme
MSHCTPEEARDYVPNLVTSEAELDALYGRPSGPAVIKEIDHISEHYRRFIEASPFVVLATAGPEGLDCTPRGDPAGFVRVVDSRTVMLPDRRGNNRIDSLRNIVRDPRVALLFLIPGIGRTLRINGRASISIDPELCASFTLGGKVPRSVIVVAAERVYTQCPKALVRSRLWDARLHLDETSLPSSGTIMKALQQGFDGDAYDRDYPQRLKETIY